MRRTKAMQLISFAAALAAPGLAFAGAAQDRGNVSDPNSGFSLKGQALSLSANLAAATTHVTQLNNNATWVGPINGSWSTPANWSTNIVPNDPTDSATFATLVNSTSGSQAVLDSNRTVGSLTFNSAFRQIILPGASQQTLTISTGVVNVTGDTYQSPNTYSQFPSHSIGTNIATTAGLNKTGPGTLVLVNFTGLPAVNSTFTGGVNVQQGTLVFTDELQLGDPSNVVTMSNNTTLQMFGTNPVGTFHNYQLNGNTTIDASAALEFVGTVAGTGTLNTGNFFGANLQFDSANSFSGVINIKDNGGVSVPGSFASVTRINNGGGLFLPGNAANHINDAADIFMYGGVITQTASTGGGNETMGVLHLAAGGNTVNVANSTNASTRGQLRFASLDRQNRSSLFVQGKAIGTAAGGTAGVGNVFFTAAPTLIGGGGAAGSTNISILPYVVVEPDANTDVTSTSFATYGANGIRGLLPSEYQTSIAAGGATDNYRFTTPQTLNAAKTVNSIVLSGATGAAGGNIAGTGTITVTSGGILQTTRISDGAFGNYQTIANPVNFGAAEGVITVVPNINLATSPNEANGLTLSGIITGTNGVTFVSGDTTFGVGGIRLTNPNSSWTGQNTLNLGFISLNQSVPATGNSVMGASTLPLIVNPGNSSVAVGSTINADFFTGIQLEAAGNNYARGINVVYDAKTSIREGRTFLRSATADGAGSVIFSGAINVQNGGLAVLSTGTTPAGSAQNLANTGMEISGAISGTGGLFDQDLFVLGPTTTTNQVPVVRLSGNNTYTGGTVITNSVWQINSNTAFGTGPVSFEGTNPDDTNNVGSLAFGALQAFGAPRTLSNTFVYTGVGALFVGNQPLTLSGVQNFAGGLTELRQSSSADVTMSGNLQNGGPIKTGTGRLILSGSSSYTGQTQVNEGILNVRHNNALGTGLANIFSAPYATFIDNTGVLQLENNITTNESFAFNTGDDGLGSTVPQATGNIRNVAGTNVIGGVVLVNSNANIGADAGTTLRITGDIQSNVGSTGFSTLSKVGPGTLDVKRVQLMPVAAGTFNTAGRNGGINAQAGKLTFIQNGTPANVNVVRSLAISATAFVDLRDNDMIIGAGTPSSVINTYLAAGYNFGNYDGQGGMSTSLGANTGITTLGMLTADEYANNNGSPTFDGIPVQPGDTLVKYTYFGDVDFNGSVDVSDYNLIDFGFSSGLSGWANGDVDYSGSVDASDYNVIDVAFTSQNGVVLRAIQYLDGSDRSMNGMSDPSLQKVAEHFDEFGNSYAAGFLSHVPEPTSLGIVGLAAGALMGRRRRRAAK